MRTCSTGFLVQQRSTEEALFDVQTSSDSRKIPDRVDSGLVDVEFPRLVDNYFAVHCETAILELLLQFGDNHVCTGESDGWANVQVLVLDLGLVERAGQVAKRIHGDDFGGVRPLGLLLNLDDWLRVFEIWFVLTKDLEVVRNYGQIKSFCCIWCE